MSRESGPRNAVNALQFEVIAVVDATTDGSFHPDPGKPGPSVEVAADFAREVSHAQPRRRRYVCVTIRA